MENETATPTPETTADPPEIGERSAGAVAARRTLALLCLLAGIGCALVVAHAMAGKQESAARREFAAGAAAIRSTLSGSLRGEQGLRGAAATFFAADPKTGTADFVAWTGWALASAHDPALQRIGIVTAVKRSQLRSFAVRTGRPAHRPGNTIPIVPGGTRPEYCLAIAEVVSGNARRTPAGLDYCALNRRLLASRGSGATIARSALGSPGSWQVLTPVYRGFAAPDSAKARNASFVGWVRAVIRPSVLAGAALDGHDGYGLHLQNKTYTTSAGASYAVGQTDSAPLPEGWQARITGPSATAPLLAGGRIWVLAAGLAIGALLGIAALLLARGRDEGREAAAVAPPTPAMPAAEAEPLYDPLSTLPNRALTLDRAGLVLARARRQSGLLAGVLLIDIDWFKDVNEKLGREAGDQLLKIVAGRLQAAMRVEDTVGRLGADRFAVLIECTARSLRLDALAQRVLESLHEPVELDGFGPTFSMTASIGVAFGRYETAEELLRDGETALAAAKSDGKGRYKLFDANTHSVVESRGSLEADLSAAVQQKELALRYEPIYELQSRTIVGFEAKPCWSHPVEGEMAAAELAQLVEDCGLTVPVDRWALEEACARAAAWEVDGKGASVSVKVGPEQLHRDGLITDVRRALQQSGVRPELLMLEIAESAVMSDVAAAAQRLQEIKQLGVRLAIDDFGDSGYAYHSDLRKMPIDCLRVDRGALAASDDPEYRNWLFEAILMVGRELSLAVLAKGVESEQQAQELQAMGCTIGQGPFLGEAVVAAEVAGSPSVLSSVVGS